jgi:hypothetical protein
MDFYCGALGMTRLFNFSKNGEIVGCYVKAANETFIEIFRTNHSGPSIGEKMLLHHFCLETDEIEKLRQELIDRGYAPKKIVMGADGTPQFWITDPNGLEVEFQEYTTGSSQATGSDVQLS